MPCPYHATLSHSETDTEIDAVFSGRLDANAVGFFVDLAAAIRSSRPAKAVRLDVSQADALMDTGLPGVLAVERAAADAHVDFVLVARPDQAADLAKAGLARVLYSGP